MSDVELGKRLKSARNKSNLSQQDMAKKLNITDKTLRNYEKGNNITVDIVRKIAEISKEDFYFLLDEKKHHVYDLESNSNSIIAESECKYNVSMDDMIVVNVYPDVYASAGLGNTLVESNPQKTYMDKTLLQEVFNVRNFDNLDMIKVIGDSMAPIINDGEVLFIERGTHAKNGDTIVAILNDELYVKRLYKDPFGEWIRLESENKEFPHIELNTPQKMSMLNIIGIARSKVKVY